MSLALALVGFDVTIMAILLTRSVSWNWVIEAVDVLLTISIFSLTFSFFVYHTILATEQDVKAPKNAERLIQKGNRWTETGLLSLILAVPILLLETAYYVAFSISLIGFIWLTYHFIKRRI